MKKIKNKFSYSFSYSKLRFNVMAIEEIMKRKKMKLKEGAELINKICIQMDKHIQNKNLN